jgi:hypothetical protein
MLVELGALNGVLIAIYDPFYFVLLIYDKR